MPNYGRSLLPFYRIYPIKILLRRAARDAYTDDNSAPGVQGSELGSGPRLSNAPVAPLIKELGALARPQQAAVYIVRTDTLLPQLISSLPASPIAH